MRAKRTVVVVEDDVTYQMIYRNRLEEEGFEVIIVEDSEGAIEHGLKADVLLIDVRLPSTKSPRTTEHVEGFEAVTVLIEDKALPLEVPIIFISIHGKCDDICKRKLESLPILEGRYTWLQKPLEVDLLLLTIRNMLTMHRS